MLGNTGAYLTADSLRFVAGTTRFQSHVGPRVWRYAGHQRPRPRQRFWRFRRCPARASRRTAARCRARPRPRRPVLLRAPRDLRREVRRSPASATATEASSSGASACASRSTSGGRPRPRLVAVACAAIYVGRYAGRQRRACTIPELRMSVGTARRPVPHWHGVPRRTPSSRRTLRQIEHEDFGILDTGDRKRARADDRNTITRVQPLTVHRDRAARHLDPRVALVAERVLDRHARRE